MDENFEFFLENMGPPIERRDVPTSSIERYRGRLPDQLLAYWQEYGWCGYADGLFWTVDPEEYEPVLEAWIGDTPLMEQDAYHIIARSAFGDLYLFGEKSSLRIVAPDSNAIFKKRKISDLQLSVRAFFGSRTKDGSDYSDPEGIELFQPAMSNLGRLNYDEMYGFVPALALGGPAKLDHLEKVKAVEHLVFLAQLAPLRILEY